MSLYISVYELVTSGSCNWITTMAECETAARALGLSDTSVEDDAAFTEGGWSSDPPYCYLWIGRETHLRFNVGTNTGSCNSGDNCLCK